MTEKEKQQKGLLYNPFEPTLSSERERAKSLLFEYNHTPPADKEKRTKIIRQFLGSIGQHSVIEPVFQCDYGYNIFAGDNFYTNVGCVILDCAKVTIGHNVLLGPNVNIYTVGHPLAADVRITGLESAKPITIGSNVWIGGNTVILPGVIIGDSTVVGAGSVVTKSIPSNVLAIGNPCNVLKTLQ
ncbi:MAG: sugar O-acetyltransferase [Prevotellaceae bacterium]|jgi:acetyltransferase-like isoleucine patch superfamily enzyme|nr:sugar O-acetyltransferase [Prevotellaceae bacterium]